ncbi:MAG: hypothetical protein IJK04_16585, partial [Kiritimatiellae bacterium]|nr:hypothetical protein [Kiritimatiellia bacterium]
DAKGMTLGEETRTSLDTVYRFFWESGDRIFVKKGSEWKASTVLSLAEKKDLAKFTVDDGFDAATAKPDGK